MSIEAMKLALEALELHGQQYPHMVKGYCLDAITALRQAIEQAQKQNIESIALEMLEHFYSYGFDRVTCEKAIVAIKESLSQKNPVAFICQGNVYMADDVDEYCNAKHIPLYTKEQL